MHPPRNRRDAEDAEVCAESLSLRDLDALNLLRCQRAPSRFRSPTISLWPFFRAQLSGVAHSAPALFGSAPRSRRNIGQLNHLTNPYTLDDCPLFRWRHSIEFLISYLQVMFKNSNGPSSAQVVVVQIRRSHSEWHPYTIHLSIVFVISLFRIEA